MSEMIERVAQAIREAEWQWGSQSGKEQHLAMAHAAIAAMREPTSEMCTQGHVAMEEFTQRIEHRRVMPVIWQAMIDAALGEPHGR